ncbi:DUF3231 family protein [Halalkalibacter kiskunsagensis]|uniref:DUF3231 family protein n=1 Tax=Halalkalibacter kiskunsagensis TaxID=1548599 RepID=A0ABV6K8C1_9BACI
MDNKTNIRLTAAELSSLWSQYVNDTASVCVLEHSLTKVEDEEVRPVIEYALNCSLRHIEELHTLFTKDDVPIPVGFSKKDVKLDAPKLLSDTFTLMYLRQMSILAMTTSSLAIGVVTRSDVVSFHQSVLQESVTLQDLSREVMLKQGTYIRPPFISTPDHVDFVQKHSFLAGFIGERRPLTAIEITHLFINVQTNAIGKTLMMAFSQCANNEEITQYFLKGKKISQKHIDLFSSVLKKEDLPAPMSWDTAVTDSTYSPFSDKLMMFHTTAMIAAGIGNYGTAMAASPRRDIAFK